MGQEDPTCHGDRTPVAQGGMGMAQGRTLMGPEDPTCHRDGTK